MLIAEIGDATFEQEVLNAEGATIVEFWATWCPPCRVVESLLENVLPKYENRIRFARLNIDDSPLTAAALEVQTLPALLLCCRGRVVSRHSGIMAPPEIERFLDDGLEACEPAAGRA